MEKQFKVYESSKEQQEQLNKEITNKSKEVNGLDHEISEKKKELDILIKSKDEEKTRQNGMELLEEQIRKLEA